jgi:hypothetical protein
MLWLQREGKEHAMGNVSPLDLRGVEKYRKSMQTRTVTKARASFSRVTRGVLKTRKPVVVRTPAGLVQIAPYDLADEVPPAPPGSLKLTPQEIALHNTFGDAL